MMSRPETSNSFETTWLDILLACETKEEQLALIATLTPAELEQTHADGECFARNDQLPPGFKRAGGRRAGLRLPASRREQTCRGQVPGSERKNSVAGRRHSRTTAARPASHSSSTTIRPSAVMDRVSAV